MVDIKQAILESAKDAIESIPVKWTKTRTWIDDETKEKKKATDEKVTGIDEFKQIVN